MNLNLTCQKTHILAWANSDETLSLKINGVKYLGFPKVDKRGGKYWKVDSINSSAPNNPASPAQVTKEEIEAIANKPLNEQTIEDRKKWEEWIKLEAQEKAQKQVRERPSQPAVEALARN